MILFVKTQFGYEKALLYAGLFFLFFALAYPLGKRRLVVLVLLVVAVLDMSVFRVLVQNRAEALHGMPTMVSGKIVELQGDDRAVLRPTVLLTEEGSKRVPTKILLDLSETYLYTPEIAELGVGDRVQFYTTLEAVEIQYYDSDVYLMSTCKSNGILFSAKVWNVKIQKGQGKSFISMLEQYRKEFAFRVGGGLPAALLFGDKTDITWETKDLFRRSGMMHMLTFSGVHFSILVVMLERILALFRANRRQNARYMLVATFAIALFMGWTPPVVRAAIMLSVRYGGILLCRKSDQLTSLFFAAACMFVPMPYLAENSSLLLTVTSLLGIGIFGEPLAEVLQGAFGRFGKWKPIRMLAVAISTAVSAQIFMTPFLYSLFGHIATYTVLANVLLFGLLQLEFFLAIVLFLLYPLQGLWLYVKGATLWIERIVEEGMNRIVVLPGALISKETGATLFFSCGLVLILVLILVYRRKKQVRPLQTVLALALLVATFLGTLPMPKQVNETHIAFLDVGQGSAAVVTNQGATFVLDCGSSDHFKSGEIAWEYLNAKGIREIEAIVISHVHADHANGVMELLERMAVKEVILPRVNEDIYLGKQIIEKALECGVEVRFAEDIEVLYERDDFRLTLHTEHFEDIKSYVDEVSNEKSVVVLMERSESSVLFTGDIGREGEGILLEKALHLDADIMQIAHHGAALSNIGSFLNAVSPSVAVIGVGAENTYGHPSGEVLSRLSYFTDHIYRTDLNGHVELYTTGDGIFWLGTEERDE